jgi:hypothetical protein
VVFTAFFALPDFCQRPRVELNTRLQTDGVF